MKAVGTSDPPSSRCEDEEHTFARKHVFFMKVVGYENNEAKVQLPFWNWRRQDNDPFLGVFFWRKMNKSAF